MKGIKGQLARFTPAIALVILLLAAPAWIDISIMSLLTKIMIFGLLAMSLDVVFGYVGLWSFCHAALFGVAAYTNGILIQHYGITSFWLAAPLSILMAAAVADYQPKSTSEQKIKKEAGDMTLELVKTADILAEIQGDFLKIGFAAETEEVLKNARQKLQSKRLDLIVANDVTAADSGFGTDTNKVTLIDKEGKTEDLPLMSKREVAEKVLDKVMGMIGKR